MACDTWMDGLSALGCLLPLTDTLRLCRRAQDYSGGTDDCICLLRSVAKLNDLAPGSVPVMIGHSHSILVFAAAREAKFELRGQPFAAGPQPPYDEAITAFHPDIAKSLECGMVFSAVNRSVHDVLSIIRHPRPFDFVLPGRPDLTPDPACELIPYRAVRETLLQELDQDLRTIALAQSLVGKRLVHLLSQPPLEDDELVAKLAPWALSERQSISPATLRLKFYEVYVSILADWCAGRGITVVRPPLEAIEGCGFLKASYCSNATHGNVAYGHLVLNQMLELL